MMRPLFKRVGAALLGAVLSIGWCSRPAGAAQSSHVPDARSRPAAVLADWHGRSFRHDVSANANVNVNRNVTVNRSGPGWGGVAAGAAIGVGVGAAAVAASRSPPPPAVYDDPYGYPPPP